ncbi:MAG: hypothetical protein MUP82_05525 [Candidatus Marinimicrobia bacterium]|nr:hypothetical protein [Candidatus Neomarinimicrobiota bacterium]
MSQKIPKIFDCKNCDYYTSNKKDYDKHLLTSKHNKMTNGSNMEEMEVEKIPKYTCECSKTFKTHGGLWKHKKKCDNNNIVTETNMASSNQIDEVKSLMNYLMKENSELKHMMMKVIETGTHNTTTNSHNKAFNLNFFLNETCKDAMNITEFVESIKLQLSDLEKVGELGYVEGISNIILKNLKNLDITQRPVHCTDKKRETMYIKDENKWEKDEEQKKMHKIVRKVADKNARMLPKFKEAHPDCIKSTSLYSDQYNKIIIEAMGGRGDNDFEKEEKIIRLVSKEVLVEKST